jgi:hypothetical protein
MMGSGLSGSLAGMARTRTSNFTGAPQFGGAELGQSGGRERIALPQDGTRVAHGSALREARDVGAAGRACRCKGAFSTWFERWPLPACGRGPSPGRRYAAPSRDAGFASIARVDFAFDVDFEEDDAVAAQLPVRSVVAAVRHSGCAAVDAALWSSFGARSRVEGTGDGLVTQTLTLLLNAHDRRWYDEPGTLFRSRSSRVPTAGRCFAPPCRCARGEAEGVAQRSAAPSARDVESRAVAESSGRVPRRRAVPCYGSSA